MKVRLGLRAQTMVKIMEINMMRKDVELYTGFDIYLFLSEIYYREGNFQNIILFYHFTKLESLRPSAALPKCMSRPKKVNTLYTIQA